MPNPPNPRITPDAVRHLATAANVRPEESTLPDLARTLEIMFAAIDRTEELNLDEHEPCTTLRLSGGPVDAEL